MSIYIVLLRGINVGGRNTLPMKELVVLLEDLGCQNVKTYIQSGNAVLQSSKTASRLSSQIGVEIKRRRGFEPHVLLLELKDFARAIAANPFPAEAESDPKGVHLGFLDTVPPQPDLDKISALAAKTERFQLINKVFFLHAPDGVGRSKLAANSEKLLGVAMTVRNWRTVSTIRDMAKEFE